MSEQARQKKKKVQTSYRTLPWHNQDDTVQGTGSEELDKAIAAAGYAYDAKQDIFYSVLNPWQRSLGYCRLYDEAAAPFGMIIDCEPIYFDYDNKHWMISLWKGQYDMVTGGEIGVYTTVSNLKVPGLLNGAFYTSVDDKNLLKMSYTLKKKGLPLFTRKDRHWWLTGFKLGEFSKPSELTMDVKITLKDEAMRNAFIGGLLQAGYSKKELAKSGNTVIFTFDKPHARQPVSRTQMTDWLIQWKNKTLCEYYQDITKTSLTLQDKLSVLKEQNPRLYQRSLRIGKSQKNYETYENMLLSLIGLLKIFTAPFTQIKKKETTLST